MHKIKYFIQQSWLLVVSSFVFGLMIAIANAAWSLKIEQNEKDKLNNLMSQLITGAGQFQLAVKDVEITAAKGKTLKTNIYKALDDNGQTSGFAVVAVGAGFADKIKLVIAVDETCKKFLGFKVLASNETPGFGSKIADDYFSSQFKLAPAGQLTLTKTANPQQIDPQIVAISGATVSSNAVVNIFNTYINQVKEKLQTEELIK